MKRQNPAIEESVTPSNICACSYVVDFYILSNDSIYGVVYVGGCVLVLSRLKLLQIILILEEKRKEHEIKAHLHINNNKLI